MLKNAPSIEEVIGNDIIVGHNASFDIIFYIIIY